MGERDEADKIVEHLSVDDRRLRITFATMDHAVSNGNDFPVRVILGEPLEQGVESLGVRDFFAGQGLIGDSLAGTIICFHAGGARADAVDLAGNFGMSGDGVGQFVKCELDRGRARVDRENAT